MGKRAGILPLALAAALLIGASPEGPTQTLAAFKAAISYRYNCTRNVFIVAIGAVNQAASGESALYWEIADSGQTSLGGVQNIAILNTLQVQAAGSNTETNGASTGMAPTKLYRPCVTQSLYVWASSAATRLPNGDIVVRFSDAVEQPLGQP